MKGLENIIDGNILIIGNNDLKDIPKKNGKIFYDYSNNNPINNLIISRTATIFLKNIQIINFSKNIVLIKEEDTVYNEMIIHKYLIDKLGYKKTSVDKNVIIFNKPITKIIYIYDKKNSYIDNIKSNIYNYCYSKKYIFISHYIENCNTIKKFKIIKKEINDCDEILFLYNYTLILDYQFNIRTIQNSDVLNNKDKILIIDNIFAKWFDSFIIFNKENTIDLLDEIIILLGNKSTQQHNILSYFRAHQYIQSSNINIIFNNNSLNNVNHICNLNKCENDKDFENKLLYSLKFNLLKSSKRYKSIYLKEYIIKIDGIKKYDRLKFCFRELLKIDEKKYKYKEINNSFYELYIDDKTYVIVLDKSEECFFGYEKYNNKIKINGVLITI
jgi:hypothetical protein